MKRCLTVAAVVLVAMLAVVGLANAATPKKPANMVSVSVSFPKAAGFCQNTLWLWKNRVVSVHYTVAADYNNVGEAYNDVRQPARMLDNEDYANIAGDKISIWAPKGKPVQVRFSVLCARGTYEGVTPEFTATKDRQSFKVSVGGIGKGYSVTKL